MVQGRERKANERPISVGKTQKLGDGMKFRKSTRDSNCAVKSGGVAKGMVKKRVDVVGTSAE